MRDKTSPQHCTVWHINTTGGNQLLLDGQAEVTVERTQQVTRTGYRPEAAALRSLVGQLQQALLRTQQRSQEEIVQARFEFESCARDYENRARDVRDVDVAQAVAA